ncbi:hypothetical protein EXIGLDRAFT_692852 [Exidia glandulosa HHB12029]|uniref:F-box domain-containing protein n=1 Tax=Exidia glandulosa HHB12029 TaxID=1314781 RepID=A0A165NXB4_EXIGL|nr:hypothetical protein EXIGLDRAFT_692852 [Exidia glandulosa HHB12029]
MTLEIPSMRDHQHPYYYARNVSIYFDYDRQTPWTKATDLINYSMTCRSIRAMCMPPLFASIVWSASQDPDPVVTKGLSPYVRAVRILYPSHFKRDAYLAFLAQFPNVRELHVDRLGTTPFEAHSLDWAFVSCPIEVMVLTISGASTLYLPPGLALPPLREFTVIAPRRMALLSQLSVHLLRMENSALEYVLGSLRDSLEVLRVPGDAMRLSFLGAAHWPRLTRFALFGGHPFADASWSDVLSVMPVLQSFILDTAYIQPAPPVYLWPPPDVDVEGVTRRSLNIANLRGLVLSSPRPRDRVFALLPPTLIELALRDTPRYDRERTAPRGSAYDLIVRLQPDPPVYDRYLLSSRGALDIFTVLRGDALLRLELVVRADAFEMRMLVQVAETCPRLRIFEYHRYRDVPDTWEWDRRNLQPGDGVQIVSH